ncbi:MAG: serine hydrolase domain-containing protein, partial [Rhodothermia bacterium]
ALTGRIGFQGKLPITVRGRYEYGDGIVTSPIAIRYGVPEDVGMNSVILSRLDTLLWNAIGDSAFPGAALAVGRGEVIARADGFGYLKYDSEQRITPKSLFDLASLTKVAATTPAIMVLYERGLIELNEPLATYLPEFGAAGKDSVTVRQILTHTSGLSPFYSFERMGITTPSGIIDFIAADSLMYKPDSLYRYSDLGMIMLAKAVERITDQEFGAFLAENVYEPLGMHDTGFRPAGGKGIDSTVVPTEVDTVFRMRLVQGEVHDERAWVLGGTAGHAGLFSTAEDLAKYASMLLNGGVGNGVRIFQPETVSLFTTRFPNDIGHTRALGWDTKSDEGYSSAGQFFGPRSFGHTGFTGTSLWMDPDANVFVILLTNRVYPTRMNRKLFSIRPRVADIVFLSITGGPTLDLRRFTKEPF